jgi:hypothetical protein
VIPADAVLKYLVAEATFPLILSILGPFRVVTQPMIALGQMFADSSPEIPLPPKNNLGRLRPEVHSDIFTGRITIIRQTGQLSIPTIIPLFSPWIP